MTKGGNVKWAKWALLVKQWTFLLFSHLLFQVDNTAEDPFSILFWTILPSPILCSSKSTTFDPRTPLFYQSKDISIHNFYFCPDFMTFSLFFYIKLHNLHSSKSLTKHSVLIYIQQHLTHFLFYYMSRIKKRDTKFNVLWINVPKSCLCITFFFTSHASFGQDNLIGDIIEH